ncbi:hypothetical protein SLS62_003475 [Diatrype stigma]|uniref:ESCRT-II complex subunit VPS25 n=1 Tax=Diatrype stigma TaxID=117547 RepID=A0AAN9USM1_9PEZI
MQSPTPGSSSGPTTSTPTPTTSTTALNPSSSTPTPTPAPTSNPKPTPTSTSTSTSTAFEFPREYHFPPFFTRQPNATTRRSQLEKWSALIQGWARSRRQFRVSVAKDGETALFYNRALGRRLAPADAREVLEFMRRHEGRAEPVLGGDRGGGGLSLGSAFGVGGEDDLGGGGGGGGGDGGGTSDVYWVYWKTPEEWAHDIEAWIEETAQKGVVFTLYELTEGEDTRGTEFHGLDPEILQKALQVLVKRGKAQIFGQEDQQGVKFF